MTKGRGRNGIKGLKSRILIFVVTQIFGAPRSGFWAIFGTNRACLPKFEVFFSVFVESIWGPSFRPFAFFVFSDFSRSTVHCGHGSRPQARIFDPNYYLFDCLWCSYQERSTIHFTDKNFYWPLRNVFDAIPLSA